MLHISIEGESDAPLLPDKRKPELLKPVCVLFYLLFYFYLKCILRPTQMVLWSISSLTVREEFLVSVSKKKNNPKYNKRLFYLPCLNLQECFFIVQEQQSKYSCLKDSGVIQFRVLQPMNCSKSYNFTSSAGNSMLHQCRTKFFTDSQEMTQIQTIKLLSQNFWCFI